MTNLLIPGLIGIAILATFLGVMLGKILSIPLIIIAVAVIAMVVYDFFLEIKAARNGRK